MPVRCHSFFCGLKSKMLAYRPYFLPVQRSKWLIESPAFTEALIPRVAEFSMTQPWQPLRVFVFC